jgi:hypothetical protein
MNKSMLILDSGAVSLYNKFVKVENNGVAGVSFKGRASKDYSYYTSKAFADYRDTYIKFVKENDKYLSGYINLDVMYNAEESYKSLKYMESKGCHPLPVFHIGNSTKWLEKYIEEGYKFICLGGVSPNPFPVVKPILDKIWANILTNSQGLPLVKVHGLACTSFRLLSTYPWYSVDSASWTKLAAYGGIYAPRKRNGKFDFTVNPFAVAVSEDSSKITDRGAHFSTKPLIEQKHILEWLELCGVPFGTERKKKKIIAINHQKGKGFFSYSSKEESEVKEGKILGVCNDYQSRMKINLYYFQALCDSLPKYPWVFKKGIKKNTPKGFF